MVELLIVQLDRWIVNFIANQCDSNALSEQPVKLALFLSEPNPPKI